MLSIKVGGYGPGIQDARHPSAALLVQVEEMTPCFIPQQGFMMVKLDGDNVAIEASGRVLVRADVAAIGPLSVPPPPAELKSKLESHARFEVQAHPSIRDTWCVMFTCAGESMQLQTWDDQSDAQAAVALGRLAYKMGLEQSAYLTAPLREHVEGSQKVGG